MIYLELVKGEYVYTVTDLEGRCLAETYSLQEAELIEQQYKFRLHSTDHPRNLYRGIQADPIRSK